MKKTLILCILFFTFQTFAQEEKNNPPPYSNYTIKFVIADESTTNLLADAQSFWKFSYELRFLADNRNLNYKPKTLESYDGLSQTQREKSIRENNKNFDKDWKKSSKLINKGKIEKRFLSNSQNREILIPVALPDFVKQVLAQSTESWTNSMFRVSMKGKVFVKTSNGLKLKEKVSQSFICASKMQTKDSQIWMINSCGIYQGIDRKNEKIWIASWSVLN